MAVRPRTADPSSEDIVNRALPRARSAALTLLTTLVVAAVTALPAAAADDAVEATGFGSGQWDGLILTMIVGAILGAVMFAIHSPGSIPRADAHH